MCIEIICRKTKYCGSWRNGGGCSVKSMFLRITKAGLVFVSLVCSWWILPVHWKVRQLSASTQHPSLISSLHDTIFLPTLTTFQTVCLGHGVSQLCYNFNY